uniref:Uncharacterized protein n=1 Tax=Glossina austeni TaxID=7395 RepID=A0A1A9UWY7_GLOAU
MEMNETRQTWFLYELKEKNAKKLCRKNQMMDDEGFLYHSPKRKKYSVFGWLLSFVKLINRKVMEINETRQTWFLYELKEKNAKKLCLKSQMITMMDDEGFLYHNPKRKKYSVFASSSIPKQGSWHRILRA